VLFIDIGFWLILSNTHAICFNRQEIKWLCRIADNSSIPDVRNFDNRERRTGWRSIVGRWAKESICILTSSLQGLILKTAVEISLRLALEGLESTMAFRRSGYRPLAW